VIEAGVVALLAANEGVSALVAAGNIFPLVLPPGFTDFPAITYMIMPDKAVILLDGSLGEQHTRIRVKCHGLEYGDAANVRAAAHAALDTFAGPLSDGTVVQSVEPGDGTDFYLSDQKVYGTVAEFTFHFD
jgi:hypothetical protein